MSAWTQCSAARTGCEVRFTAPREGGDSAKTRHSNMERGSRLSVAKPAHCRRHRTLERRKITLSAERHSSGLAGSMRRLPMVQGPEGRSLFDSAMFSGNSLPEMRGRTSRREGSTGQTARGHRSANSAMGFRLSNYSHSIIPHNSRLRANGLATRDWPGASDGAVIGIRFANYSVSNNFQ